MTGYLWLDIIIALLGIGCLLWGLRSLRRAVYLQRGTHQTASWLETTGQIQSFKLGRRYRASGFDGEPGYDSTISYVYQVEGQSYEGDSLYFGSHLLDGYLGEYRAQLLKGNYKPGTTVKVYYNPDNPTEAVLGKDWLREFAVLEFFLGGLVLILIAAWIFWRTFA